MKYELEILLKARDQATASLKALNTAVQGVQSEVGGLGATTQGTFAQMARTIATSPTLWLGLSAAVGAVSAAVAGVGAGIYHLAQHGGTILPVKQAFDNLTAAVGGSNEMLKAGREGTKGLITDFNLMTSANRLLGARIPLTTDQFRDLSRHAVILGRAVGIDASEALDRMSRGIAKLEPEILDEINIKISAVEANRKYAEAIGKSVKELTAQERTLAFMAGVQQQAAERAAAYGGLQLTLADYVTIARNRLSNLHDELAVGVSLSPALTRLTQGLGDALLNAFGSNQEAAVTNIVKAVDWLAITTVKGAEWIVSGARLMSAGWHAALMLIAAAHGALAASIEPVFTGTEKLFRLMAATTPLMSKAYTALADSAAEWGKEMRLQRDAAALAFKSIQDDGQQTQVKLLGLASQIGDLRVEMEQASKAGISHAAVTRQVAQAADTQSGATGRTTTTLKGYAKTLAEVSKGLQDAEKNQAPVNFVITEFGSKIKDLVREAAIAGKEVPEQIARWYQIVLQHEKPFRDSLRLQVDLLRLTRAEIQAARAQFRGFEVDLMPLHQRVMLFNGDLSVLNKQLQGSANFLKVATPAAIDLADGIDEATEAAQRLRDQMADKAARDILNAFSTVSRQLGGIFGDIVAQWTSMFDAMISASEANNGKLWQWLSGPTGQRVTGGVQVGVQTFTQGYGLGQGLGKTGGTLAGAGAGAAQGALVGTYIMPGLGTAAGALIGGVAGAIGGFFGGKKKEKEEKEALKELQTELLKTYGGMENLKKVAEQVGVNIDRAFDAKKPKEALQVIERFTAATERHQQVMEGLGTAVEALDMRSSLAFGGHLNELVEERTKLQQQANALMAQIAAADEKGDREGAQKLRDQYTALQADLDVVQGKLLGIGATGQEEFDRLGIYAAVNLAGIIKQTGDVRGAFEAVGPTLDQLTLAQENLGLTANETVEKMLRTREFAEANGPTLDTLSSLTQMTKGWGDAGLMTRALFQTVAADMGAQLGKLVEGGENVDQALALAGPTLQWLWEQQQKYGGITDETTKKLLEQAEAQGLVGEHQKSINQQMLDATLGLSQAVKDLAATLRGELPTAAATAAKTIQDEFSRVRITIPVEYDERNRPGGYPGGGGGEYAGHDAGGVVPWTPGGGRLVRVAETRTEHIMSDEQLAGIVGRALAAAGGTVGGGGTIVVRNEIGGRHIDELVIDAVNRGVRNGRIAIPQRNIVERVY